MAYQKLNLPKLPYKPNALVPIISEKIVTLHHDKHHLAYVNGANAALEKLDQSRKRRTEIDIKAVLKDLSFHYSGAKLHDLYWQIMQPPKKNNLPKGKIKKEIEKTFGSFMFFQKEFNQAAITTEGSGWAALVKDKKGRLFISQIEKHNLILTPDTKIILVNDVWEHAYYLDYLNNRADYVLNWWQLVNWNKVEKKIIL